MDTTDPEIVFDGNGVCNYCLKYKRVAKKRIFQGKEGEQRINLIAQKIKSEGKGKKYDCIIGVSGGVDSTMVAFISKKKLGLFPLAVHLDNGWDSEFAVSNIEKTLKKLDIDLYTYVINWEEFKDLQLSFLKASVANVEIPTDHAITSVLLRVADEKGVKYIITGSNFETEGILPRSWGYFSHDYKHIKSIHDKFGRVKLRTYPYTTLFDFFKYFLIKNIKFVRPLNLIHYNKKEAIKTLQKEIGWESYHTKHFESIFTRFFQAYILPKKFGFDKRKAHLSSLICSEQMARVEALEEIKKNPYPSDELLKQDREFVLKKLGLTEEEFEHIMKLPVKTYRDYLSHSLILNIAFNFQELIKRIITK